VQRYNFFENAKPGKAYSFFSGDIFLKMLSGKIGDFLRYARNDKQLDEMLEAGACVGGFALPNGH
jgi:hypothetical protein